MGIKFDRPRLEHNQRKGISGLWDKIVRKSSVQMLIQYVDDRNQYEEKMEQTILSLETKVNQLEGQIHQLQTDYRTNESKIEHVHDELQNKTGALARQVMLAKWKIIDKLAETDEKPEDIVCCKICGYSAQRASYDTKITACRFNGGKLERYICPKCGVIFGPTKFSSQSQEEIDEDYMVHYYGFSEAVLTEKEIEAFFMLNPTKEGIYLDYGCGCWSKTIEQLRAQGYNVYGYEPYAPEDNPYMITSKEELSKHKFDGIFSNDLLEHLIDPVEDLKQMKKLLKSPRSAMSHSTACYIYKHEVTRFHTHFFTGNSVQVMSEKAGLQILDFRDEMDEKDFMCYVYGPKEDHIDYTTNLYVSEYGERKGKDIIMHDHGLICGPYMMLGPEEYKMKIKISGLQGLDTIDFKVTADKGKDSIATFPISNGETEIRFTIDQFKQNCEFVLQNEGHGYDITVHSIDMY